MRAITSSIAIFALSLLGLHNAAAQTLMAYIESPDSQTSTFAGVTGAETETFDTDTLGDQSAFLPTAVGTFEFSPTAQGDILVADQYGGANGTQYMSFGAQSGTSAPITIVLNKPANTLGFWFSAGDANNGITLYSGGTQFARFSTADIISLLSGSTVTSLSGSVYASSAYLGNPNGANEDSGEPFAYVQIIASSTFDTIVLDNSGTTGTGFETDNFTVASGTFTAPGTDVFVGTFAAVPEPSHYAILMGLCVLALVSLRRWINASGQQRCEDEVGQAA
jgi:hypothetical protein